ncbi:MAG: 2-dehydro-3-deoxygalactonokinase, partial [Paracoccaceae bacterium]
MNINKRAIGPDWLAVDWGTTHLRIWLLDARGHILAEARDDSGMATLSSDQFYARFTRLAGPFLSPDKVIPVVACGMIGAKQGWHEAPYIAAPCAAPGLEEAQKIETRDERFSLYILPGVKQTHP